VGYANKLKIWGILLLRITGDNQKWKVTSVGENIRQFTPHNYTFNLDSFEIKNTRAKHNDTDYVSFALQVGNQKFTPQVKKMGDLNNGTYYPSLSFGPVLINDPNTTITFNYTIANLGHGDSKQVQGAMSTGASQALDQSNLGEPWKSVAKVLVEIFGPLFFANCDGVVANDQIGLNGNTIFIRTDSTPQYSETRNYPGTDSPSGCGSNSVYNVAWSIKRQ
jgi:hypothetical protein